MPRQHVENTKEFWSENEAKRANKHANKRIIYWPPFWNKVYRLYNFTHSSQEINLFYYMANPVLGKSLCSDWFFLGQDFAVRTVSMETVQSVYFCFGAKPANSTFATKTAKKKCETCHS